jgi:hypothetical protein
VLIREAYNLKDLIGELKQDSAKLQSNTALAHVLKIVNYFKANAYRGDDDDLLRALADAFR